jgi:hypothetical protein
MAEERPKGLGHGENELAMGQTKKGLVRQILGEKDGSFSATGWAQVESLAREGSEVVMATLRVGTADTRNALEIITASTKPVAELLDALKAVSTVGGCVLLVVLLAEVVEVSLKYGMKLVAATGNVLIPRHRRDGDCLAHTNVYGRKRLRASDRGTGIERHITWRIHQTPSRRSAPARAQVMRVVIGLGVQTNII